MGAFFAKLWTQIKELFSKLTRGQKIRLAVVAVLVVVIAIVIAVLLGRVKYGVLYSRLTPAQAGDVIIALDEMAVPHQEQGTGTILIPEDQISRVKMQLAQQNIIDDGPDLSILMQGNGYSTNDFQQQLLWKYQLQQEIRGILKSINKIDDALVILHLPENSPFVLSQDKEPATAAIQLVLKNGDKLTNVEANTVAQIAMAGVEGLLLENVSISDDALNMYTLGDDEEEDASVFGERVALEQKMREQLVNQVTMLLAPIYGENKMKVSADVRLNFDDERSENIQFAPPVAGEEQGMYVARSELYENSRIDENAEGVPGTDTNGMGTVEYPYNTLADGELYNKTQLEYNYEMDRLTTQIEKAKGSISHLSIGVILDSESVAEDYTDDIVDVVAMGTGASQDNVAVVRLPFNNDSVQKAIDEQNEVLRRLRMQELLKTGIICATILLVVLAIIFFLHRLLRKPPPEAELVLEGVGSNGLDILVGDDGTEDLLSEEERMREIELAGKSEALVQLEKFIEKDPAAVAQLLRNWLQDD